MELEDDWLAVRQAVDLRLADIVDDLADDEEEEVLAPEDLAQSVVIDPHHTNENVLNPVV